MIEFAQLKVNQFFYHGDNRKMFYKSNPVEKTIKQYQDPDLGQVSIKKTYNAVAVASGDGWWFDDNDKVMEHKHEAI